MTTNSGTAFVDDFDQDLKLLIISMQEDMRFTWQCWSSKKSMEMTKKLRHYTNWIWPTTTTFQVEFPASLIICPGLKHWICTIIALLESYLCLLSLCISLVFLDQSTDKFQGEIPDWIGESMPSLKFFFPAV